MGDESAFLILAALLLNSCYSRNRIIHAIETNATNKLEL